MFSLSQLADVTSRLQLAELSGHQFHEKFVSGRWIKIFFPQIFMGCMLKPIIMGVWFSLRHDFKLYK